MTLPPFVFRDPLGISQQMMERAGVFLTQRLGHVAGILPDKTVLPAVVDVDNARRCTNANTIASFSSIQG